MHRKDKQGQGRRQPRTGLPKFVGEKVLRGTSDGLSSLNESAIQSDSLKSSFARTFSLEAIQEWNLVKAKVVIVFLRQMGTEYAESSTFHKNTLHCCP